MKLAVILAFLFYGSNAGLPETPATDPCENLKVETEVKHTTDKLKNGEVELTVTGGTAPFKYVFFNEKGYPLSFDNDSNTLNNRGAGKFFCTVIDNEGCQKKIKIDIK